MKHYGRIYLGVCILLVGSLHSAVLWRIGLENGAKSEFTGTLNSTTYTIPADWQTRTQWTEWQGRSDGHWGSPWQFDCAISFTLNTVPQNGCEFDLKTLAASNQIPELAVFANGNLCGVIQMCGTTWFYPPGSGDAIFGDLYRLYIPKEFLKQGTNNLRLKKLGHPYASGITTRMSDASFPYLSFDYDYLRLVSLDQPAKEPLHGRYINLGFSHSSDSAWSLNEHDVAMEGDIYRWAGICYSGNICRAGYWIDITWLQFHRLEYLQELKNLNMQVLMDYLSRYPESNLVNNRLPASAVTDLRTFFNSYGPYFQYYELSNEPTMSFSNESFLVMKAIALEIQGFRSDPKLAHIKITAPGYNYAFQQYGTPAGWDGDSSKRRDLETLCDATNGHSYGSSYRAISGGSFKSTVATCGGNLPNGLPKEFVNSEFGDADGAGDYENNDIGYDPVERKTTTFDHIMRFHVAFGSKSVVYAADDANGAFRLIDQVNFRDPLTWIAHVDTNHRAATSRWTVFRQYALAYATHGTPLPFIYTNGSKALDKLSYCRFVNTQGLDPLPGSGAVSNKILLNFVNFDCKLDTVQVRITMPQSGLYSGDRFGPQLSYKDAHTTVQLNAVPTIDVTEILGPRQSIQYILEPQSSSALRPTEIQRSRVADTQSAVNVYDIRGRLLLKNYRLTDAKEFQNGVLIVLNKKGEMQRKVIARR